VNLVFGRPKKKEVEKKEEKKDSIPEINQIR